MRRQKTVKYSEPFRTKKLKFYDFFFHKHVGLSGDEIVLLSDERAYRI
jgi:hypothetical protein